MPIPEDAVQYRSLPEATGFEEVAYRELERRLQIKIKRTQLSRNEERLRERGLRFESPQGDSPVRCATCGPVDSPKDETPPSSMPHFGVRRS